MCLSIVAIVAITGCGDESIELASPVTTLVPAPVPSTEANTGSTAADDESAWCDAMVALAAAQPAGSYTTEEHEAAFLAYADAAEAAARAPGADSDTLEKLAAVSRISAADAGDLRQAELYDEIATALFGMAIRAEQECGVEFG